MEDILKAVQLASHISQEEQQLWKEVSDDAIRDGEVAPLSVKGLFEVIDNMAYEVAKDAFETVISLPDRTKVDLSVFDPTEKILNISKIHYITSLASGVHPEVLATMVNERMDYYADEYIRKYGGNSA